MDNTETETAENRNSNTEYVPTKCRITKPPPPKPATNPLQFVKVAPCPLFQKAHQQIKKADEIRKERKEVREEPEDWQQNLDNWKSCRRKAQEHIIERVVEVKKLEQEEHERYRRKSVKTFNEMIEGRNRGRHKFIPVYDDDSNDLSDYGIGSSSSKANSIKDVDTDDSSSILDEKDHSFHKDNSSASNQSQSEDEGNVNKKERSNQVNVPQYNKTNENNTKPAPPPEQYTYEGAIQDYRSRIRSKIHVDESIFTKSPDPAKTPSVVALPKGEIFKRKELFEAEKQIEINNFESPTSRRLSEDFANSQSIKQRLQSLEKCTDQQLTKDRLQELRKQAESSRPSKISSYLTDNKPESLEAKQSVNSEWKKSERCSSPETELYMDNLKTFSRDLDNLMLGKGLTEYCANSNYPASTSSTELMGISDREDSGIHTADVSCAVSQSDELVEDAELAATTIPSCIEILSTKEHDVFVATDSKPLTYSTTAALEIDSPQLPEPQFSNVAETTRQLLADLRADSENNHAAIIAAPLRYDEYVPVDIIENFSAAMIAPPTEAPPPPPPADDDEPEPEMRRINSTKRIKREIHKKRSSFLGLDEPSELFYPEITVDKPPDINAFLQKESKLEKTLYRKAIEEHRVGVLSKVESHDSGLDIDRGRLSSDTWCSSSIGESITPSPERQDSEQANSITSEEDEMTKKEREIIEIMEKEEKSRDGNFYGPSEDKQVTLRNNQNAIMNQPYYNDAFYPQDQPNYLDDQDSEVLKVEHDLCQLEQEELKRKQSSLLFEESRARARLHNNRRSLENIFDVVYPPYQDSVSYRKSMSDLQHSNPDYSKKPNPEIPNPYSLYANASTINNHRKSMPDIQRAFKPQPDNMPLTRHHGKSLPEIDSPKRQPIMPGKPIKPPSRDQKDRFLMMNPTMSDALQKPRQQPRHNLQATPKTRHLQQHWLVQEAELRRISEQSPARTWRQDKPLPDSVIQTLTQMAQSRVENSERNQKRSGSSPSKEGVQFSQHPYLGHALPMPYPPTLEEGPDRMLSVSGKKKCSNCNKELGRGAAMIIESLCLFYHMECFICCVCHMQLGDGRMGTDVRVRNHKLHCHNCYSSEDGIKFSCV